jgi:hypothetical protein
VGTLSSFYFGGQSHSGKGTVDIAAGAAWDIGGDFVGATISGLNLGDRLNVKYGSYSAGERAVLNRATDVLSIFAAGDPTAAVYSIQLQGAVPEYGFTVTRDAVEGFDVAFDQQKLSAVSANNGEVDITPTGIFAPAVTVGAGVTVSGNYYGAGAQAYGVYAGQQRATLTNAGTIVSSKTAVDFASGGLVTNVSGAVISGNAGVRLGSNSIDPTDTVGFVNSGTVTGQYKAAVYLSTIGAVTNNGEIYGAHSDGVQLKAGGEVSNQGDISALVAAVHMYDGGVVYNGYNALLTGFAYGVEITGAYGRVTNRGAISSLQVGLYMGDGGLVVNQSGGITGATFGLEVGGAAGNIANSSYIQGILLADGGTIVNAASGIIEGVGIVAGSAGAVTVINSGVIQGSGGTAVNFGSASDWLIAEAGSRFSGVVNGGGGVLELSGAGAETITGLGGAGQLSGAVTASGLAGFASYIVDAGISLTLTGPSLLSPGQTLSDNGVVTIGAGTTLRSYGVVAIGGSLNLAGSIVGLTVGSAPAGAGVSGVDLLAAGAVTLTGTVQGGAGLYGHSGHYQGGVGGVGISAASTGTIASNSGRIIGGAGGGGAYGFGPYGGGAGGAGVSLGAGVITNNSGTIAGGAGGLGVQYDDLGGFGGAGGDGIDLASGGTVTNTGGAILGGAGGAGGQGGYYGGNGGAGGAGVALRGVGTVVNTAGSIVGGSGGGGGLGGYGSGSAGQAGDGVVLAAGGVVVNGGSAGRTALISGATGVYAGGGGAATVVNFGTIQGTGGVAVQLSRAGDRLVAEAGSTWLGAVRGGGGTLELAGGTGTLTGLGGAGTLSGAESMTFSGFGAYAFDAGASWTLAGGHTLAVGQTLTNAGTLNGALALGAASDRLIVASGSTLIGAVTGGGGALELAGGAGTITGLGATGTLSGAASMTFSGFGSYVIDAGASWTLAGTHTLAANQILTNAGTLNGGLTLGAASDRLIVASGSTLNGAVKGGGGMLQLTGGGGTITGLGVTGTLSGAASMTFSGFGSYAIDAGATWTLNGANKLGASQSLTVSGALINNGSITTTGLAGVDLSPGGLVDNALAVSLISGTVGVYAGASGAATVVNFGTIKGTGGTAVQFGSAGDRLIVEAASFFTGAVKGGGGALELAGGTGTISGLGGAGKLSGAEAMTFSGFGSYLIDAGGTWTVTGANTLGPSRSLIAAGALINSGTLNAYGAAGVDLLAGGSLTNNGAIAGNAAAGVYLSAGASVVNAAAKRISGVAGVEAGSTGVATLTNFGTIQGTGGTAVQFGSAGDRLIAESGSTCLGAVKGGGGTLELAAGTGIITGLGGTGTLSGGEAMTFGGFGSYVIDAGGSWALAGADALAAGQTLTNAGALTGTLALTAASDRLIVDSGSVTNGSVTGGSGVLELAAGSGTISGLGATGTLSGAAAMTFSGFGSYAIDAGASWTVTGANSLESSQTLAVAGALTNTGTINGAATAGVDLSAGGSVDNAAASLIYGVIGVYAGAGGAATVTNGGAIGGSGGVAVSFLSAGDRLIVEAGASFVGYVQGGGGTLELASGTGSLSNLGGAFTGFGAYTVDAGGDWTLYGINVVAAGLSLGVAGSLADAASLANAGTIAGVAGAAGAYGPYGVGGPGGAGATALTVVSASASLTNTGRIAGGVGGMGGQAADYGGTGGSGAAAVAMTAAGSITNAGGSIVGGAGGQGGFSPDYAGGAGGAGGAGITLSAAGSVDNISGAITGGAGGAGNNRYIGFPGGRGGAGVALGGGGSVAVSGGTITGGAGGVGAGGVYSGAGGAGGAGVALAAGGTVTDTGGAIVGGAGAAGGSGDYSGGGGAGGAGVLASAGGTIANSSGSIIGGAGGAYGSSGWHGSAGAAGDGIALTAGGVVTNGSAVSKAALIEGLVGVYAAAGAATVTSWGTIEGTGGTAVQFGSAGDRLVVEAGSTWLGAVKGGGGTLELAGGTGTISGLGTTGTLTGAETMTFSGFGSYQLDASGALALHGKDTVAVSLTNAGTLTIADKASLTIQGVVSNSGQITLAAKTTGASLIVSKAGGTLSGGGSVVLGANALNTITGSSAKTVLTNVNDTIGGAGQIGAGELVLVNQAAGIIEQSGSVSLTINTGTASITNAGTIEATGAGGLNIASAVANTGLLEAIKGNLTLGGAVTGTGSAVVNAGTLDAASTFTENVTFSGTTGELELEKSQTYTGSITGFSTSGKTSLYLADIGFVSSKEATFSGTKTGGILTVTDGTHTARISLVGNYTKSSWVASSDGSGVIVIDPSSAPADPTAPPAAPPPATASPPLFIAAMAGLGAGGLALEPPIPATWANPAHMLVAIRTQMS